MCTSPRVQNIYALPRGLGAIVTYLLNVLYHKIQFQQSLVLHLGVHCVCRQRCISVLLVVYTFASTCTVQIHRKEKFLVAALVMTVLIHIHLHVHSCTIAIPRTLYLYPVQTCSHVLLSTADKVSFLDLLRRPTLSSQARKSIAKKINEKCKKMSICPHCGATNGE